MPRTKEFKGNRSAKDMDKIFLKYGAILWPIGMQDKNIKVRITSMFLTMLLCGRRRCGEIEVLILSTLGMNS